MEKRDIEELRVRVPHKHSAPRRHRIGKMKFMVTNWPDYEEGLRRRGSLTLWLTPEAVGCGFLHDAPHAVANPDIPIWQLRPP